LNGCGQTPTYAKQLATMQAFEALAKFRDAMK
jgi:hypothetical protein